MYGIARRETGMAYNNGFPMTYQPMYYQQPQQPVVQQQTPVVPQPQNNGIIWVQGEAGAKSYLVAPNNTVQLWDSETQTIYLKSADASGMPSMKILDYKIRNAEQSQVSPQINNVNENYVTLTEFNGIKAELSRIKDELSRLKEASHEPKSNE